MASIKKKTWARRISKTPVSFNNNNNNNNNQYIQQNLSSADANTPSKNINGKSAQGNEYVVFEVESPADMNSSMSTHGGNVSEEARRLGLKEESLLDASASLVPFSLPPRLYECLCVGGPKTL